MAAIVNSALTFLEGRAPIPSIDQAVSISIGRAHNIQLSRAPYPAAD